jgi:hypothetical protein
LDTRSIACLLSHVLAMCLHLQFAAADSGQSQRSSSGFEGAVEEASAASGILSGTTRDVQSVYGKAASQDVMNVELQNSLSAASKKRPLADPFLPACETDDTLTELPEGHGNWPSKRNLDPCVHCRSPFGSPPFHLPPPPSPACVPPPRRRGWWPWHKQASSLCHVCGVSHGPGRHPSVALLHQLVHGPCDYSHHLHPGGVGGKGHIDGDAGALTAHTP